MKNYSVWKFCVSFFILLIPILLEGQEEALLFHHISSKENLTSQTFNDYIFKDSYGFVWISSVNGLNRFDGQEIKQYLPNVRDKNALLDGNIQSKIFEDKNKNLWFTTYTAIHKYDRKNDFFHHFKIKGDSSWISENYQLYHLDSVQNNLWVRAENKLFLFPIDTMNSPILIDTFSFTYDTKIEPGNELFEQLLFAPSRDSFTITFFRNNQPDSISKKNLPGIISIAFYFENDTVSWIGTNKGLIKWSKYKEGNDFQMFNQFNKYPVIGINGITPIVGGKLIITTFENGIFYFDTDKFTNQLYLINDENPTPFLYPTNQSYLDQDENLWISSPGQGVYFTSFAKKKFNTFSPKSLGESIEKNNIKALTEDSEGRIWCLTNNGISLLDKNGEQLPDDRFQGDNVPFSTFSPFYIFCDHSNRIWVLTDRGVYVLPSFDDDFIPVQSIGNSMNEIFISQLSNGKILISSGNDGMYELDEKNLLETGNFIIKPSLELKDSTGYSYIFEDSKKNIYLCRNQNKILVYDSLLNTTPKEFPFDEMVNGFIEDEASDTLWIATWGGLFYMNLLSDSLTIQKDAFFPFQSLEAILQDSLGNLWISTNRGLVKYKPGTKPKIRSYNIADGLQSLAFQYWSALKTSNKLFAFGGVNGINIFNPLKIKDIQTQARPTITEVKINGELPQYQLKCDSTGVLNISEIHHLVFNSNENSLNIKVAALEYSDPSSNQFRYRMKGRNDDWIYNGTDNTINLSFLSPGYYNLEVDATNSDGAWSENPHQLQFRIKPPWYFSIYAIIFYILATIGIVYAYYRYRITQIRKEANYKQMIAETETAVLRLQMNPHFIFNSMNSISSYILQKDIKKANHYLGRFAKLMRMILDFAAKPLIEVTDEIDLLTLYLQTEAMRFEQRFNYSISYDESFDPDEFLIPPMILQPFVENAILHGFTGKKEKGKIDILFWEEDNSLFCSVADNGIGRKAAAQINTKAKTHESKALSITKRRLELLKEKDGIISTVEFIDLIDENKRPAGTKVLLRFPIF